MPLTEKGEKIESAMKEKYGAEKGEQVFYASKNKGTITGVDRQDSVIKIPSGQGAMSEQLGRHGSLADGPVAANRALQTRAASNTRKC